MVGWMAGHLDALKLFAVIIGSVLVVAMTAWTASVIANTVAMLANPMTWIIIAIVAAVALLVIGIYELVKHWGAVWGWIKGVSLDVWHALVTAWNATIRALMVAVDWVKKWIVDPIIAYYKFMWDLIKPLIDAWMWYFKFAMGFMGVVVGDFVDLWKLYWGIVMDYVHIVWDLLKLWWSWVSDSLIHPLGVLIGWLADLWKFEWKVISTAVSDVWSFLKTVWSWLSDTFIKPLQTAMGVLSTAWSNSWNSMKSIVQSIWNALSPIFNKITNAISAVRNGLSSIANAPSSAGASLAHLMGFDSGGWVPGSAGQAQLAIVHGGEYVLSRDMIAAGRSGPGGPMGGPVAGPTTMGTASTSGNVETLVVQLNVDGQQLHQVMIKPAQIYKKRNGTTGLS
jgi:phage-related protein